MKVGHQRDRPRDLPRSRPGASRLHASISNIVFRILWPGAGRDPCLSEGTMQRGAAVSSSLGSANTQPSEPTASPGLEFERFFTVTGSIRSTRSNGRLRSAVIGNEKRRGRLRAARRRDPEVLVAAGHQHRRLEVFPRPDRHAGARAQRQAADRPRRRHDHRVGARAASTSPAKTTCRRSATS